MSLLLSNCILLCIDGAGSLEHLVLSSLAALGLGCRLRRVVILRVAIIFVIVNQLELVAFASCLLGAAISLLALPLTAMVTFNG